jgi:hypothetical protein
MTNAAAYAGRNRRRARPSKAVIATAGVGMAAVAFVTLCPIGLRPHFMGATLERLAAYLAVGLLISRAAGRRAVAATVVVIVLAFGLEVAQLAAAGRHARMAEAVGKALGGVTGVAAYQLMFPLRRLIVRLSGLRDARWETMAVYVTTR